MGERRDKGREKKIAEEKSNIIPTGLRSIVQVEESVKFDKGNVNPYVEGEEGAPVEGEGKEEKRK
jgi:hypothetical protein